MSRSNSNGVQRITSELELLEGMTWSTECNRIYILFSLSSQAVLHRTQFVQANTFLNLVVSVSFTVSKGVGSPKKGGHG